MTNFLLSRLPFQRMNTNSLRLMTTAATSSNRLQGKVAVVTASTRGIGLAIAERLAKDGARVVLSSRKQNSVDEAVNELKQKGFQASGVVCHVSKTDDRKNLLTHSLSHDGKIDILVSNAAVNPSVGQVFDTSEEAWDKIFDTNVKAAFMLSKEFLPHIRKGGSIIYVSSIAGLQIFPLLAAYSVSKTALIGLTKAASMQCAPLGIRVNCLAPGIVRTKFSAPLWSTQEALDIALQQVPLGRIAEPHETAGIVAFLCSEEGSYITGETFVVAGGMPSRL